MDRSPPNRDRRSAEAGGFLEKDGGCCPCIDPSQDVHGVWGESKIFENPEEFGVVNCVERIGEIYI